MQITFSHAQANEACCPRCHSPLETVVVHGHEQCVVCKSNIFECCSGEQCQPPMMPSGKQPTNNHS
ncbi:MAG: hypothetical protein ACON5P_01955 [Candidatus Puniceispirillaceae bacterium]